MQGAVRRSQGPTSTPSSQAATWPLCPYRRHIYSLEKETLKDSRLEDSRREAENTDVNWGNSLIDGEIPTPFPAWFPDHGQHLGEPSRRLQTSASRDAILRISQPKPFHQVRKTQQVAEGEN